jgi:glutathione peroxidase
MSIRHLLSGAALCLAVWSAPLSAQEKPAVLQHEVKDIEGRKVDLSKYKGKVVLIVNVASECGYTGQYEALQKLHKDFGKDGLVILGFPSNDFGGQEPGTEAEIKQFATSKYGVEFPLFSKVGIAKGTCPLYKALTADGTPVRWNFEKFLIGRDGRVAARFASDAEPDGEELLQKLRAALGSK